MTLRFDRSLEVHYGEPEEIAPGLRRIVAENPGPFTFKGTATFVIGHGDVAVIDPGPKDERHIEAVLAALAGERVTHILITHTHPDHSPGAALLQERTGARTHGFGPHPVDPTELPPPKGAGSENKNENENENEHGPNAAGEGEAASAEERGDTTFVPDIVTVHGDRIAGDGWAVEAVHTPGHLANHLCFALPATGTLFSGDHVMGWSTTVISPPGGNLADYLASCELLLARPDRLYVPTHGSPIHDPHDYVRALVAHRHDRTRQIVEQLRLAPTSIAGIVAALYVGLDPKLEKAAGRSVRAHLDALIAAGDVVALPVDEQASTPGSTPDAPPDPDALATFRLA